MPTRPSHAHTRLRQPEQHIVHPIVSFFQITGIIVGLIIFGLIVVNSVTVGATEPSPRAITASEFITHKYHLKAGKEYSLIAGKVRTTRVGDWRESSSVAALPLEYRDGYEVHPITVPLTQVIPHIREGAAPTFALSLCDYETRSSQYRFSHVEAYWPWLPIFHTVDDGYEPLGDAVKRAKPEYHISIDSAVKQVDVFLSHAQYNELWGNWANAGPLQIRKPTCQ